MTHTHKGKGLIHGIGVREEAVALLNVTASAERKPHHNGAVRSFSDLEVELTGVNCRRGIHNVSKLRFPFLKKVERLLAVGEVILHQHGIRLGTARCEFHLKFLILKGDDGSLTACCSIEEGIRVNRRYR